MMGDKVKKEITDLAQKVGYLIIDEAHSVGVVGEDLMGIVNEYSLNPEKTIKLGTLGKALGSYGGYILAKKEVIEYLINRAKSIIYTTALSPMDTLLAYFALEKIEKKLDEFKKKIEVRKKEFNTESLIKIIKADSNKEVIEKQKELLDKKILVGAIRPPTTKEPIFRVILRTNIDINLQKEVLQWLS
jgi:8-amino-7-oxononanoate synthase